MNIMEKEPVELTQGETIKRKQIDIHTLTIYIGTVAIYFIFAVICAVVGRNFLTWIIISNIIVQASIVAVVAIGASYVILTGGIDLSVGSIIGLIGIVCGLMIKAGIPIILTFIISIIIGGIFGLINGVMISRGKLPPFIMTLGMMSIARGITLTITGGNPVAGFPMTLGDYANITLLGIPVFIIYVIVFYALMVYVSTRTKFGRHVYAIGGNRNAARLSGVKVRKVEVLVYVIAGVFAAIGGLMLLSRLSYAAAAGGEGYELDVIAAVVIGGISLSGGEGKVVNTLVGALMLGILKCGMQILNLNTYYQQIATGLVITIAVFIDKAKERKAE
ncbi:MAG: ABC transporter permease [Christensenellales bacterium]